MDHLTTDQLLKLAGRAVSVAVNNEGTELENEAMAAFDRLLDEVIRRNDSGMKSMRVRGVGMRIQFRA